jgi:chemosensory pili system protein ChpA (sensor histidine kinase/response regulator)
VQTIQQALLKNFDGAATAMAAQMRLNRELQQNLMNVRMVPFASIGERLHRVVRQTAKELNKRANLELLGTELELDRSVLEKMTAPFEHLLRNALVHGIESEPVRAQAGKTHVGEIRLALRHEGNEVVFELSDDGSGLDFAALRDKATTKGLLKPGETASDDRLAQLIFTSGISTATKVTEVAGHGIGMGVVCGEIAALGGHIEVNSRKGLGTRFTIHLPLTLAVTHVLMVRSGKATYAIPSAMVEQVRQVKPDELAQFYRARRIEWQGNLYPLHYLPQLLGDSGNAPENLRHNALLLLRSGEQRIALHVDGLLGNQEAMVKNTGPQLARLPVIAGATVQGNGTVALILNPAQLAQRASAAVAVPPAVEAAPEKLHTQPLVMVVDDSLTVRKVTTRLLTRAGYQVVLAKDGVDALEQLDEISPDVMLLDIEMPRMDGFELTKHLRRDARTQNLPIIMITSRTADKHRDYALQLGANAYLGKPYQEELLLQQIAGFITIPETTAAAQV